MWGHGFDGRKLLSITVEVFRIIVWLTNDQWCHILVGSSPTFSFLGVSKARTLVYRIVIALILLGCFIYGVYDASCCHDIDEGFFDLRRWANDDTVALSVVIICWYLFVIPTCLNSFLFTFGTAYIYAGALGFPKGLLYSVITVILGTFGGQFLSFFVARYACPQWIERFDIPRVFVPSQLGLIDSMQYIMALRIFPTIPTSTLNYSLAISSSITVKAFCLATVGNWPAIGFWMFFGAAFGAGISNDGAQSNLSREEESFVWCVGLLFAIATVAILYWLMRIEAQGTRPASMQDIELGKSAGEDEPIMGGGNIKEPPVPRIKNLDDDREVVAKSSKSSFAVKDAANEPHFDTSLAAERANRNPDPRPPVTKKLVQSISKRISKDRQSADEESPNA